MTSSSSRRIAFFHLYLYRGGGERVLVDLANGFAKRGHRVDLILMQGGGPYMAEVSSSVHIIDFRACRILQTLPRLIRYLRRERPDVLLSITKHTHLVSLWARMLSGVETKVVLRVGIPFSLFLYRGRNYREYLLPILTRTFYRFADAIVANSRGLAEDFIKTTRAPRHKVRVIYNPKQVARIREHAGHPVDHPWLNRKDTPVIMASGRLTRQKGFDVLIRALAEVRRQVPARLIVLGSGGSQTKWRKLAEELNMQEAVSFAGFVENPYAYLARADIFALSSRWEGLPNVLVEALICGLPVVATDCPYGPREILAPDTSVTMHTREIEYAKYGVLVPVDNHGMLATALAYLLANEEERRRYAENTRIRSADFDAAGIISQYEDLFFAHP